MLVFLSVWWWLRYFVVGDETQQVSRFFHAPGSQVCAFNTALLRGAQPQSTDTLRPQAGKYLTEAGALTGRGCAACMRLSRVGPICTVRNLLPSNSVFLLTWLYLNTILIISFLVERYSLCYVRYWHRNSVCGLSVTSVLSEKTEFFRNSFSPYCT